MSETLLRHWLELQMIPRAPRAVDAATIERQLRDRDVCASRRSIQRDLVFLSGLFPIECRGGTKPYGWCWSREAKPLQVPGVAPHTALMLELARRHLEPAFPRSTMKELDAHLQASGGVLDAVPASRLKAWLRKVRVLPRGMPLLAPEVRPEVLEVVYDALLNERRFAADYRRRGEKGTKRLDVNPLGLVLRGPVAYVVCTLREYGDVVQLVLHRIERAERLDRRREVPEGFDLDRYLASGALGFTVGDAPIRVEFRVDATAGAILAEAPLSRDQRVSEAGGGRLRIEATVPDNVELRAWLLGFGDLLEVLAPAALRAELAATTARAAARYAGRGGDG